MEPITKTTIGSSTTNGSSIADDVVVVSSVPSTRVARTRTRRALTRNRAAAAGGNGGREAKLKEIQEALSSQRTTVMAKIIKAMNPQEEEEQEQEATNDYLDGRTPRLSFETSVEDRTSPADATLSARTAINEKENKTSQIPRRAPRNNRSHQSREDELTEAEGRAILPSPVRPPATETPTSTSSRTKEEISPHKTNVDDDAFRTREEDLFAARMLQQQNHNNNPARPTAQRLTAAPLAPESKSSGAYNQNSSNQDENASSSSSLFQIGIQANHWSFVQNPNSSLTRRAGAGIYIQGPEMEQGLLAIVLMTLTVQRWNIIQVLKMAPRAVPRNPHDETRISTFHKEEEKEEERRSNCGGYNNNSNKSRDHPVSSSGHGEPCIVVEIPGGGDSSQEDVESKLNDLRLLLLSTCNDFALPPNRRRPLRALMDAFETTVLLEQTKESSNKLTKIVHQTSMASTPTVTTTASSSGVLSSPVSRNQEPVSSKGGGMNATNTTTSVPRVGAVPTMGRAFGAPVRQEPSPLFVNSSQGCGVSSRSRNSTATSRMSRRRPRQSRWRTSAQHWIGTHILGPIRTGGGARASLAGISEPSGNNVPIAAEVVETEEDMETNIRKKLMMEATTADIVSTRDSDLFIEEGKRQQRKYLIPLAILAVLLVGTVIGLTAGFMKERASDDGEDASGSGLVVAMTPIPTTSISSVPSASPTVTPPPTLSKIVDRDTVRCCVNEGYNLGLLEVGLCRGLAAGVLGDGDKIDLVDCTALNRFQLVKNRKVDVLIASPSRTTSRSIREETSELGFAFSSPYLYDGLAFGGPSEMLDCADRLDTYFGQCRRVRVCVQDTSTHYDFLKNRIPSQHLRIVSNFTDVMKNRVCNVIGADASLLPDFLFEASGLDHFNIGTNTFTKEPLAMATRPDDYAWTLFVEAIFQGLVEAAARGITQANAFDFPDVPYGGSGYEKMVAQAIDSVGNFQELCNHTIDSPLPLTGLNRMRMDRCEKEGGLIYSIPFGSTLSIDPTIDGGPTIARILDRRVFQCGVPSEQQDKDLHLFNLEICKAISAALFESWDNFQTVEFAKGAPGEILEQLQAGKVEIMVGVGSRILPMLGSSLHNYVISAPYFYQSNEEDGTMESFGLATRSNDHQWSVFVEWIVNSLIFADEESISQEQLLKRKEDSIVVDETLGEHYARMFQQVISAVGNYNEIYERTVTTPRSSGCNQLNLAPHGPQRYPFLFDGL